jgi:hypothetical protein
MSCHQTIPNGNLAVDLLTHMKEVANIKIDKEKHNSILHKLLLVGAWTQITAIASIPLIIGYFIWRRRKKNRRYYY